jgi:hypothetical protein
LAIFMPLIGEEDVLLAGDRGDFALVIHTLSTTPTACTDPSFSRVSADAEAV